MTTEFYDRLDEMSSILSDRDSRSRIMPLSEYMPNFCYLGDKDLVMALSAYEKRSAKAKAYLAELGSVTQQIRELTSHFEESMPAMTEEQELQEDLQKIADMEGRG